MSDMHRQMRSRNFRMKRKKLDEKSLTKGSDS